MNGQRPPFRRVGHVRAPRLDKTFSQGGGAKDKGPKDALLALITRGPDVGVQIGGSAVLLTPGLQEEFSQLWAEARSGAASWEPPGTGDAA